MVPNGKDWFPLCEEKGGCCIRKLGLPNSKVRISVAANFRDSSIPNFVKKFTARIGTQFQHGKKRGRRPDNAMQP
jgi:hypothetical protein